MKEECQRCQYSAICFASDVGSVIRALANGLPRVTRASLKSRLFAKLSRCPYGPFFVQTVASVALEPGATVLLEVYSHGNISVHVSVLGVQP